MIHPEQLLRLHRSYSRRDDKGGWWSDWALCGRYGDCATFGMGVISWEHRLVQPTDCTCPLYQGTPHEHVQSTPIAEEVEVECSCGCHNGPCDNCVSRGCR